MNNMTDDSIGLMLKASAESYLSELSPVARLALGDDPLRLVDRSVWFAMAELGWCAVMLSEEYGGSGLGLAEAALLAETMGEKLLGEPFIAACILPTIILNSCDSRGPAASIAGAMARGELLISLAWQEQDNASCAVLPKTRFQGGLVTGCKQFVQGCEEDGIILVTAESNGELCLLAIDAAAEGVHLERFAAGVGSQVHITLEKVKPLYEEPLLRGQRASTALLHALTAGRIVLSAELAGYARGCLDKTIEYLAQREQFGRPIGSFQSIQHRCVDLDIECRLGRASWLHAIECYDHAPLSAATQAAACSAKARCGDAALAVAKEAVHMHGAMGFSEETGIGVYLRAALQGAAWLGNGRELRRDFLLLSEPLDDNDRSPPQTVRPHQGDPNSWSDDDFRLCLRNWICEHYPEHLKQDDNRPFLRLRGDELVDWLRKLNEHGWRAPAWPKECGGMGLSFAKQLIYQQEMERAGVGRIIDTGETQLGPTLMTWGTDEQKAYYMPRILQCDDVWCQGYSEPGSGSDLASLRTKAELQGDEFIVNGQKIWTTHATDATHIFTLVRTGSFEKKQQGISFLLIDLRSAGITIRPIRNIAGEEEFCEVFFDNVRVPACNLVGRLHEGWSVAKSLLGHERIWLGSSAMAWRGLAVTERLLDGLGLQQDQGVMDSYVQLLVDLHDYRQLYGLMCDEIAAGQHEPGPEASILKVYISELLQRITEFNADIVGNNAGVVGTVQIGSVSTDLHWALMMARPVSIYAGTNEVQRDILAKNLLKMPSAPKA